MNSNLTKLEYKQILENVSTYCKTYTGKKLCLELLPSNNFIVVKHELAQTSQAYSLLVSHGSAPIDEFEELTSYIKNLESFIPLNPKALLEIAKVLRISNNLKDYFNNAIETISLNKDFKATLNNAQNSTTLSILSPEFETLYSNQGIYNSITKAILDENNISDDASKTLNSLRRNKRRLESNIKEKLNSFIHSSNYSRYIMEPIITIRNDRYVIPVKIEYKENINGLIHDISASGSTVYIEPTSVFDLNNQINNIKLEENLEIEKILEDLSKQLYPIIDNIKKTILSIGKIDFIFAKAKYSQQIDGIEPIINTEKFIDLKQARHPLIDSKFIVPIDINLGKSFTSLLITGPNTGRKNRHFKNCWSFMFNGL